MYVTQGLFKGRKLIIPDRVKPTLSKTRESVFNVLKSMMFDFNDKLFLDLFTGSGIMSLEALSRGFKTYSIEKNPYVYKIIKQNFSYVENEKYKLILGDSRKLINKLEISPDVVYIDPPWEDDYEDIIISSYNKFKNSILVIESDKKTAQNLSEIYAKISMPIKEKIYGRCKLDFIISD